jgi:hypothetical protein
MPDISPAEDTFAASLADVASYLPPSDVVPEAISRIRSSSVDDIVADVIVHPTFAHIATYFRPIISPLEFSSIGRILLYFLVQEYPSMKSEFDSDPAFEDKCIDVLADVVRRVKA